MNLKQLKSWVIFLQLHSPVHTDHKDAGCSRASAVLLSVNIQIEEDGDKRIEDVFKGVLKDKKQCKIFFKMVEVQKKFSCFCKLNYLFI